MFCVGFVHLRNIVHISIIVVRHVLAVMHFHSNLRREKKLNADNSERVKVSYPKFKNGEATIRSVRVAQNFGKLFCEHKQHW